jgi:GNAT superfamily N-acetyltransferase
MGEIDREQAREVWLRARLESEYWISGPDVSRWREEFGQICERFEPWVATRGKRVLGFLALGRNYVDQLHVEPTYWREGVGTALLRHAIKLNPDGLSCFTNELNHRSRQGLEQLGFEIVGETVQSGERHLRYRWTPRPAA